MSNLARLPKRTIHHKIPRSRQGSNDPSNLVHLDARWHDTLHAVFGNATPEEYFNALNREPLRCARLLARALIRNFGVSIIRDALH